MPHKDPEKATVRPRWQPLGRERQVYPGAKSSRSVHRNDLGSRIFKDRVRLRRNAIASRRLESGNESFRRDSCKHRFDIKLEDSHGDTKEINGEENGVEEDRAQVRCPEQEERRREEDRAQKDRCEEGNAQENRPEGGRSKEDDRKEGVYEKEGVSEETYGQPQEDRQKNLSKEGGASRESHQKSDTAQDLGP